LPAGGANAGPSDFLFTAAADYLLLRIVTRHNTQRRNIRRLRDLLLDFEGTRRVLPERAAMEDLRRILVLKASTGLQHTLLVADDTAGASLQPTTSGNALHLALRSTQLMYTPTSAARIVVYNNSGQARTGRD
jgi:hypothetical protein